MSEDERDVQQRDEATTSRAAVNLILEGMRKMQEELLTVRRGQEEAAERSERISKKEHFSFKRKGNEMQHQFNDKVADKVAAAAAAIGKVETASSSAKALLERAAKELNEGMALLVHRQKIIKLADRSEAGWSVVEEYEGDDLADDSDDERRMEKAEARAEKKMAKKRKIKEARAKEEVGARPPGVFPVQRSFPGKGMEVAKNAGAPTKPTQRFPSGTCFECGEAGHWRRECPKAVAGSAYPLSNSEYVGSEGKGVGIMNVSTQFSCLGDNVSHDVLEGVSSRCWEVQECEVHEKSVRGRLKGCLAFWKEELKAPPWILDTVENGYVLPFFNEPEPYTRPNQKSALIEREFVNGAVADLLAGGYIEIAQEVPHVCSPLSVITNQSGKRRLVVNLRHVNRSLWKQKFKYEDLRVVMMLFGPGEWMFSFDLKSGYHHIDVAQKHRKYLGFSWESVLYRFVVLPFGLSSAPYVFTKMMRPLVRLWRSKGLKVVVYLDDGICALKNELEAREASSWVKETLAKAGWVYNGLKSNWQPTRKLEWLGFDLDMGQGCISVPLRKIGMLKAMLTMAVKQTTLKAKFIASLVGKIISMSIALGPVSRFMTRALYALLETRGSWCEFLAITREAQEELLFWVECLQDYNAQPIWHSPSALRCVYSDASDTGYGGYTVEHGMHIAQGNWLPEEAKQSSTWRELVAVGRVLMSVAEKLRSMRVRWFTDNQNVVRILKVGSSKSHLQVEALKVFKACVANNIRLEPEWIPREKNELADYFSRIIDYDDWYIDQEVYKWLDSMWGPHTVDRFATSYNAQIERFNSRYACPGSEAVDAFTVDWSKENNWWCPPPMLVPRVLRHAEHCRAQGTLVVPLWESAPFWPLVRRGANGWAPFVSDCVALPLSEQLIQQGRSGSTLFNGKFPNTEVIALRIEF